MGCDCSKSIEKCGTTVKGAIIGEEGAIDETFYGLNQDFDEGSLTDTEKASGAYSDKKSNAGGKHGDLASLRFCNWAAPEVTGTGEGFWADLFQIAQLAIAVLNGVIQGEIYALNEELAEDYYQMAKDKLNRFRDAFVPLEVALIHEVDNVEEPEMDCDDDRERAEEAVNLSFDYIDKFLAQKAKQYRMCLDDTDVAQFNFARNKLLVDTENYNLQDDAWYCDFKSDQRWSRRNQVLNLGRNLSSIALDYGDVARSLLKNVGDIADKATSGISYAFGYYGTRFDTYYPSFYLSSGGNASNAANVGTGSSLGTTASGVSSTGSI